MSHSIKSGIITFEGKKYRLDKDDRLAAQAASLSQISRRNPVADVNGATTLTTDQSGYTVHVSQSTEAVTTVCTLTLPPVAAAGVNYSIKFGDAYENIISASAGEAGIYGFITNSENGAGSGEYVSGSLVTNKTAIVQTNGKIGDYLNIESDGVVWHVNGHLNDIPTIT